MVEIGWTVILAAQPAPGHTVSTGYPASQIRNVVLDDVQLVDFGPRSHSAGFMHTGLDQFGVRWTIDRRNELTSKSSWASETGTPGALIGRYQTGESLESIVGDLDLFHERMEQSGNPVQRNSYREFHAAHGYRKELDQAPQQLGEVDQQIEKLMERRRQLEAGMIHTRWLLGFATDAQRESAVNELSA